MFYLNRLCFSQIYKRFRKKRKDMLVNCNLIEQAFPSSMCITQSKYLSTKLNKIELQI